MLSPYSPSPSFLARLKHDIGIPEHICIIPLITNHPTFKCETQLLTTLVFVVYRPWIKLPCRKIPISPRILHPPCFAFPKERESKQKHHQPDSAYRVEHIGYASCIDPWRHGKNKNGTKRVPRERKRYKRITNNLAQIVS